MTESSIISKKNILLLYNQITESIFSIAVFTLLPYRKINIFGNQTYLYKAADIYIYVYIWGIQKKIISQLQKIYPWLREHRIIEVPEKRPVLEFLTIVFAHLNLECKKTFNKTSHEFKTQLR